MSNETPPVAWDRIRASQERRRAANATTDELEGLADLLDGHACTDDHGHCPQCVRALAVEAELDARAEWDHDDARVRESVGNYR